MSRPSRASSARVATSASFPATRSTSARRNLTPDKETGIGDWTDGEIARAMREGVEQGRPRALPADAVPHVRETLSDDDVLDIIAYLRTLQAGEERSRAGRR